MKGFGFKWVPAPDRPEVGPKTLTDWRYDIHEMALAKERGYKPDAKEQDAYGAAVDGTAADGPDVRALDGCIEEVDGKRVSERRVRRRRQQEVQRRCAAGAHRDPAGNAAFVKSKQDTKVVKAFADWSACMQPRGYHYKQSLDASDDAKLGGTRNSFEDAVMLGWWANR